MALDLDQLAEDLRVFAEERNWNQFHLPKNLAMALAGEVGELVAEMQWLTPEQCEPDALDLAKREAIETEIADVLIYLTGLADRLNVNLEIAVARKLDANRARYTIDQCYGSASKVVGFDERATEDNDLGRPAPGRAPDEIQSE